MTAEKKESENVPPVPEEDIYSEEERFELDVEVYKRNERIRRRSLEELDYEEDEIKASEPLRVHSMAQMRKLRDPEPVWDGWLYEGSSAMLAARGGLGKTALMLGLACAMYHGMPYLGSDVKQGRTLYIAGEGHLSIAKRVAAWERYNHVPPRSTRIDVIYDTPLTTETLSRLAATVRKGQHSLVIADTISALARLENESSNTEASRFIRRFQRAVYQGNRYATPVMMHHVTIQFDARGHKRQKHRGASAFRDDNDTTLMLDGTSDDFSMSTEDSKGGKQRDAEARTLGALALQKVFLPGDRDAAVVIQQTPDQQAGRASEVRRKVELMEPGEGYASSELKALWGLTTNQKKYQELRSKAVEQGLIEKGDGNKAPYRRVEGSK